jgi:hypothetical protein
MRRLDLIYTAKQLGLSAPVKKGLRLLKSFMVLAANSLPMTLWKIQKPKIVL